MSGVVYFHERQRFRQSWLWVLIAVSVVVAPLIAVVSSRPATTATVAVPLVMAVVLAALFALVSLETTVTSSEIAVSFHGLWPTRKIRYDEIESYVARKYGILDSGGWGAHLSLAGMTYNVSGNRGVAFALRGGRRILIGTQRPFEFVAAVRRAMAERAQS